MNSMPGNLDDINPNITPNDINPTTDSHYKHDYDINPRAVINLTRNINPTAIITLTVI